MTFFSKESRSPFCVSPPSHSYWPRFSDTITKRERCAVLALIREVRGERKSDKLDSTKSTNKGIYIF